MFRSSTLLILTASILLAIPSAAATDTAPVTIVTGKPGTGFIHAGQMVWHGPDCLAPTRISPEGEDSYVCPPTVKLPYPPPPRRWGVSWPGCESCR